MSFPSLSKSIPLLVFKPLVEILFLVTFVVVAFLILIPSILPTLASVLLVPVWKMIIEGIQVQSVAVPYVHPRRQTEFEAGSPSYDAKRLEQALAFKQALDDFLESRATI